MSLQTVYRVAALYSEGYGGAVDYPTLELAKAEADRMVGEMGYRLVHIHKVVVGSNLLVEYVPAPVIEGEILDPWRAAAQLRADRRRRGLTQAQEAKRLGVTLKEIKEREDAS